MKIFLTSAALVSALTGSAALGGGLATEIVEQPVVVPAAVPVVAIVPSDWTGLYAGATFGMGDATFGTNFDPVTSVTDTTNYGVYAGYNYDFGTFVVGGEISYDKVDFDVDESLDNYVIRAGGRVGYDGGDLMPYATAGFARLSTDNVDDSGFYYGAGFDYRVTEAVVIGAQYLRHEFDDFNSTGSDIEVNVAQFRVAYQF